MNISELFQLTQWITQEIEKNKIPQKYNNLQAILQQNTQRNQQQQPFESQKDDLFRSLQSISLGDLTRDQLKFLDNLGILENIGKDGVSEIEDVLYINAIDIATAAEKIQKMMQALNQGIEKSKKIREGLSDCVSEEEYEADGEILMRVSFTGHALMQNISDFKTWGNIWYDIGRGIAMAHNSSPEDIKVVGATNGSIIIEFAVIASIATTTSGIILAALKVAEKVLDVRIKAEELRSLKLKNEKLADDLEKEAENEKDSGISQITAEVVRQLALKIDEGDKVKALSKAVTNLVNFIEKGGVVDFVIPESDEENDSEGGTAQLRVAFQEIRQLEDKIALLEHKIT